MKAHCQPLEDRVRAAYANARENGYSFKTAAEWAEDMVSCDADLETEDPRTIVPIIENIIRSEARP